MNLTSITRREWGKSFLKADKDGTHDKKKAKENSEGGGLRRRGEDVIFHGSSTLGEKQERKEGED